MGRPSSGLGDMHSFLEEQMDELKLENQQRINQGKVRVGAGKAAEKTVLGRDNSMCKKRELGLLRELKVVLCMTGNLIARCGGKHKRPPGD